jgi:hypothetical protein
MADDAETAAAAQRATEQARLRKERREAKIKAGGSARLNRITGAGGRVVSESSEPTPATSSATPAAPAQAVRPDNAAPSTAGDPDEVDISQHFYEPKTTRRAPLPTSALNPEETISEDQLRQLMLGLDPSGTPGQQPPPGFPPFAAGAGANGPPGMDGEDPIMKMMTQMMSGGGFPGAGSSPFPGMVPGFQPPQAVSADPSVSLWKLLHALVSLGLGLYIAILTPFTGTKIEREREALSASTGNWDSLAAEMDREKHLFLWAFATAETLLLTTRFFLLNTAGSGVGQSGIVGTVVGFLPDNIRRNVLLVMRYGQIFTTVRSDILSCMFVLGVCSWLRT